MNILIKTGLVRLLFASGLTDKPWFRNLVSFILWILILSALYFVLYFALFKEEPYELLIEQDNLRILSKIDSNFPLFGENNEFYYIIFPNVHYKASKSSSCPGFIATRIDSWCGNEKIIPICNPGTECLTNKSL